VQSIIIFIITLGLFSYFLVYLNKRFSAGLHWKWLLLGYFSKILLGCLYGYIYLHYYGGDDTWYFNKGGAEEFDLLRTDPVGFFKPFNPIAAFERYEGWGKNWYYYLVDLEWSFITKPLGLFHIVSGGNYYINAVLFNFIQIWSALIFLKWVRKRFQVQGPWPFLLLCFFPPIAFWLSGIRGDGYLFLCMMLVIHAFDSLLTEFKKRSLCYLALGIVGVLIFRQQIMVLLAPALLVWYSVVRKNRLIGRTAVWVYGTLIALFILSSFLPPSYSIPLKIASLQNSYRQLHGKTILPLGQLDGSWVTYIKVLPQAFSNSFLRPFPWEAKGALQLFFSGSHLLFWFLLLFAVFRCRHQLLSLAKSPAIGSLLIFSVSLYLIIGFTVPYPGAIVRYIVPGMVFFYLWIRLVMFRPRNTN